MSEDNKKLLRAELLHIVDETREFDPPYIYRQNVANSDPAELIVRYVLANDMHDGFLRLWEEKRLDLTVENLAWQKRAMLPPRVAKAAADRLAACGFDVRHKRNVER